MSSRKRRQLLKGIAVGGVGVLAGCTDTDIGADDEDADDADADTGDTGQPTGSLRYVYPGYFGADAADLVPMFEEETDIGVEEQQTPADATGTREFYVNLFVAQSSDFDVGNMDVIWPGEFAGNGWTEPIEDPEGYTDEMLETPVETVTIDGELQAMPLHTDANALYYRTDKLEEHGFEGPPETESELVEMAQTVLQDDDEIGNGYIWQGGANEGLTIMWLNWVWGRGGSIYDGESVTVDTQAGVDALQHAVDLIHEHGITPEFVPASSTDENRETFQQGNTLFMRNWPYAVALMNEEGSPIAGDFEVAPLPTHEDQPDAANSCLGGWNLFINTYSENTAAAQEFVSWMASEEAQRHLATEHSRLPVRADLYEDEALREEFEELVAFEEALDRASARPTVDDYPRLSEIIFTECNNALVREKTPEEALADAQGRIDDNIN